VGTFIRGGTLLDGTGAEPIEQGAVLVEGKKIVAVGPEPAIGPVNGHRILDVEGGTIVPGLINLHDHLHRRMIRYPRPGWSYRLHSREIESEPDSYLVLQAARNQLIQLKSGVTTVRDVGCRSHMMVDLRRSINEGVLPGPRLLVAGNSISMTGGHGASHREVDGVDEVRKGAREQLRAGADFLKLMATGGILNFPDEDPGNVELSEAEMRAAVEEAHKMGRKVTAHAHAARGIKNAIRAGVDCIEHGSFLDEEAIELFLEKDVVLDPTLSGIWRYTMYEREAGNVELADVLVEHAIEPGRASVKRAMEAGVTIGVGTDSAGIVAEEIELLAGLGMSPMHCLVAATKNSAKALGLLDQIGTLEPDKAADVVVLGTSPLDNIRAFYDVKWVLKEGSLFEGESVH
jgi:imidazolonepropionase-like amidohydrolase